MQGAFLLVPAGGQGLRMGGGEVPKQFRLWRGVPLLQATIQAFLMPEMPKIAGISLAVPEAYLETVMHWDFGVPLWATVGGATRQASVQAALALLPDSAHTPVMVHDAVRPFPPALPLRQALDALHEGWDGALLGEPSTDTLKRVDATGHVLGTEERSVIFRAQTPQIARLSLWRQAFAWADRHCVEVTDDASLLEAMGCRVKLIPSPSSNFKITYLEDWEKLS